MEAGHPIGYFAMNEILKNVFELKDITFVKVVFITGPHALRQGYLKFMQLSSREGDQLEPGSYRGFMNKTVHKEGPWVWKHPQGNEKVVYKGEEMSKIERDNRISGSTHWSRRKDKSEGLDHLKGMSCEEYLYRLDHPSEDIKQLGNNKF